MKRLLGCLAVLMCALSALPVLAGPNAGGTLIFHTNDAFVYTPDNAPYCTAFNLESCEAADNSALDLRVFWAVAAFPAGSSPRLKAISFGISYDDVLITDFATCGDFELTTGAWPGPNTGVALMFNSVRTDRLTPVYWFSAYSYDGLATLLSLTPHPTQGGGFGDDAIPANIDPIAAYGSLGFGGLSGSTPCPIPLEPHGACCFYDGSCQPDQTADKCAEAGGAYYGDDSVCEPNPCPPAPGACCFEDGTCQETDPETCSGQGGIFQGDFTSCESTQCAPPTGACCFYDGSCLVLTEAICLGDEATWYGIGTVCIPNPCPQPTGACCLHDGDCATLTAADCTSQGGTYKGNYTYCYPQLCPPPIGACCFYGGSCVELTEADCASQEGTWLGMDTECTPNPCPLPLGACCFTDGHCNVRSHPSCTSQNGVYQGDETVCSPNPCPEPIGACCFPDHSCEMLTASTCVSRDGMYRGDHATCSPNPCLGTSGACCFHDGSCAVRTEAECPTQGGTYQGNDISCSPNPCPPPTGACCFHDGTCTTLPAAVCASENGVWQGIDSVCSPNPCPLPQGACCFHDGACAVLTSADCSDQFGAWRGADTDCSPNECPQPTGACCFPDGSCAATTQTACTAAWQGMDTVCSPNPCPSPTGACCYRDGRCSVQLEVDCVSGNGTYSGNGTDCSTEICPQPTGACCFPNGDCTILYGTTCESELGSYQGNGSSCVPNLCPQPLGACCFEDGSCQAITELECVQQGGVWFGSGRAPGHQESSTDRRGALCDPNPCPQRMGACCTPDGTCTRTTDEECTDTYQGDDSVCSPNPCPPPPSGACCFFDGSCQLVQFGSCATGGSYQGDGTVCVPNSCSQPPKRGACCFQTGLCNLDTAKHCGSEGGDYQGDDTACDPNPCSEPPATGACCFASGSCELGSESECASGDGTYQGDGTACEPNRCPPPTGSCCRPEGTCTITIQSACSETWIAFSACAPNPCEQPNGSCCHADGTCTVTMQNGCSDVWTMFASCAPNACPEPHTGACCVEFECEIRTEAECNGTYFGDESDCDPTPCPPPPPTGACCLGDGACIPETETGCTSREGMSWDAGADCDPSPCSAAVQAVEVTPSGDHVEWQVHTAETVEAIGGRYRAGGEIHFKSIPAFIDLGDRWSADIPAEDYGIRGIEYFFSIVTRNHVSIAYGDSLAPKRIAVHASVQVPAIAPLTLRMIAAPLAVDDRARLFDRLVTLFGQPGVTSWRMGRWDPANEGYRMVDAANPEGFETGVAYWIGFAAQQPIWLLEGTTNFPAAESEQSYALPLEPGWNMVGNPAAYEVGVSVSNLGILDGGTPHSYIEAATLGLVSANVYSYAPSLPDTMPFYPYDIAPTQLSVWDGLWVLNRTSRPLELKLPARGAESIARARSAGTAFDWSLALSATAGAERRGILIGVSDAAQDGIGLEDAYLPPPSPGAKLRIGSALPTSSGEADLLLRDVRSNEKFEQRWTIEVRGTDRPILLTWSLSPSSEPIVSARVREIGSSREWDMAALRSLELPPGDRQLELTLRRDVQSPPAPALAQLAVEPNPFARDVVIRYHLAQASSVRLTIFDAAGTRIWSRQESTQRSGDHAVIWDGRDERGIRAPVGTYFLELDAPGTAERVASTKIVRLR